MKLSVRELAGAEKGLMEIGNLSLPTRISFKIARIIKKLTPELENFHKVKNDIVKKYGETKDGEQYTIPKENVEKAQSDVDDLLKEEIEVDIKPVLLSELEGASISPLILNSLDKIITEG